MLRTQASVRNRGARASAQNGLLRTLCGERHVATPTCSTTSVGLESPRKRNRHYLSVAMSDLGARLWGDNDVADRELHDGSPLTSV